MIKVSLTAQEWELFSDMPGVGLYAMHMNNKLSKLLNEHREAIDAGKSAVGQAILVRDKMYAWMEKGKGAEFGALDSEPQWRVVDEIRKAYRLQDHEFDRWMSAFKDEVA